MKRDPERGMQSFAGSFSLMLGASLLILLFSNCVTRTRDATLSNKSLEQTARSIQGDRSKPLASKPKLSEDEIKVYGRKMTTFGEWCAEQGMPISYHHHMAAAIETPASTLNARIVPSTEPAHARASPALASVNTGP